MNLMFIAFRPAFFVSRKRNGERAVRSIAEVPTENVRNLLDLSMTLLMFRKT